MPRSAEHAHRLVASAVPARLSMAGVLDIRDVDDDVLDDLKARARAEGLSLSAYVLPTPPTYTHAIVATGNRMLFVAGQEPEDADGNLVGPGDLATQARQVFANLGHALAAAGARPEQVARITIYVVGHRPEYLPLIEAARVALFGVHKPVDTLVGVQSLARPEYLIEVDATAVLDERTDAW